MKPFSKSHFIEFWTLNFICMWTSILTHCEISPFGLNYIGLVVPSPFLFQFLSHHRHFCCPPPVPHFYPCTINFVQTGDQNTITNRYTDSLYIYTSTPYPKPSQCLFFWLFLRATMSGILLPFFSVAPSALRYPAHKHTDTSLFITPLLFFPTSSFLLLLSDFIIPLLSILLVPRFVSYSGPFLCSHTPFHLNDLPYYPLIAGSRFFSIGWGKVSRRGSLC